MKASEIISVLARGIERYGDKPVIVNTGDGIFRELTLFNPGQFVYVNKVPRNGKNKRYMYFDADLT